MVDISAIYGVLVILTKALIVILKRFRFLRRLESVR